MKEIENYHSTSTESSCVSWYLLIIEDQENLPGKSIAQILKILNQTKKFNFVNMDNIEGAPIENKSWIDIKKLGGKFLKIEQILLILLDVKQFDWADFFLFKNFPSVWENDEEIPDYPKLISLADLTIRAVDDQYIYIYTQELKIIDQLKQYYNIESIKEGVLENLEHPF